MSISMLPRHNKPKDFTTLWNEQRSLPAATKSRYTPGNPYSPGSANYRAWQAFVPNGFASDDIMLSHAQHPISAKLNHAITNLDSKFNAWLQGSAPSRTETCLANMDRTIRRLKVGY